MQPIPGACLSDADDNDLYVALERYAEPESRHARIDFCKAYLNEIKSGKRGGPNEAKQLARAARVGWYLSTFLIQTGDLELALMQLSKALDDATASGYHDVQYLCLTEIGNLYIRQGKSENAVQYYQLSLLYSWTFWPTRFLSSLQGLARAWSSPSTINNAVLIFDWMLNIEPHNVMTLCEKFEAMAANGKDAELQDIASAGPGKTCASHAICAASYYGRKNYDEAKEVAQAGLLIARRLRDSEWKKQFTTLIQFLNSFKSRERPIS